MLGKTDREMMQAALLGVHRQLGLIGNALDRVQLVVDELLDNEDKFEVTRLIGDVYEKISTAERALSLLMFEEEGGEG